MPSENDQSFKDLVDRLGEDSESLSKSESVELLNELRDHIEFVNEEAMRRQLLTDDIAEYVKDLKDELNGLRAMRFITVSLALGMSSLLFCFVAYLFICSPEWFLKVNSSFQAPLIITFMGGAILLVSLILKGVFRTRSERNKDEVLPEHIKALLEVIKDQN